MNIWALGIAMFGLCLGAGSCTNQEQKDEAKLTDYVNTLIGTGWVGNTFPGASAPFGMVQLSPDNGLPGWDRIAGYYYPDSTIAGFSHTHLSGTGAGDMYDVSFLPTITPVQEAEAPLGVHARFRHETERTRAGYYSVLLDPYNIQVELTATEHIGVQRYTFGTASDTAVVYLDLSKAMNWDRTQGSHLAFDESKREIRGYRYSDGWARGQKVYFYTKLSQAPERIEIDSLPHHHPDTKALEGYGYRAKLYYKVQKDDQLTVETALSATSIAEAINNYGAEKQESFDAYERASQESWSQHLSTIRLPKSEDKDEKTIFYTALYHSLICPTVLSDVSGSYPAPKGKIVSTNTKGSGEGATEGRSQHKHYSTFSLWDTYRTAHPLYNVIMPQESRDMVKSMIDFAKHNDRHLPVWNMWGSETDMMIGHHSLPVIAAALEAGIYKSIPTDEVNKAELRDIVLSTLNRKGYRAMEEYRQLGYVPADVHRESLSLTLEYAYDDWAGARILDFLSYKVDAQMYYQSAKNYRHLWDAKTGYLRPRLRNGQFKDDFDAFAYTEDVTESNAYQYLFSVQQDPEGLVELMGGEQVFAERLDKFFSDETPAHVTLPIFSTGMLGQYAHGNEPGHHVPFMYYYAHQPWRTSELVYEIMTKLYTNAPEGLCGNEDCGQMSAWYIMTAMGLYPTKGDNEYFITSPLHKESVITPRVSGAKTFRIIAPELSKQNKYIKSVKLNGKPYPHKSISLAQIQQGGTLELEMTSERGLCWYK